MEMPIKDVFIKAVSHLDPSRIIKDHLEGRFSGEVTVIGFGKAVLKMAIAVESTVSVSSSSIISIPHGSIGENPLKNIRIIEGARKNLPDEESCKGTFEILKVLRSLDENSKLILLISGGGSACLSAVLPPMTLQEKVSVIETLSRSGASIRELNTVRKRISAVKGGKLIREIPKSVTKILAFVLSDVIGDPLDYIASGTTVPNTDSPDSAERILKKYDVSIGANFRTVLDTPERVCDPLDFSRVDHIFVGNLKMALNAVKSVISVNPKHIIIDLNDKIEGEAADIGRKFGDFVLNLFKGLIVPSILINEDAVSSLDLNKLSAILEDNSMYFIGGGETVVSISSNANVGIGGRNQELVLAFTQRMIKENFFMRDSIFKVVFLSCGTDGIDGPTDAAGAFFDENLLNTSVDRFLENHDSYTYFSTINNGQNHVKIGHTGTNVLDLYILKISLKKSL